MRFITLVAFLLGINAQAIETYNVYRMQPGSNIPTWGAIDLSQPAAVTGVTQTINGGTGSSTFGATAPIVYSGGSFSIPVATSVVNGYLSATDYVTFNSKQPAGNYITALTGDGIASGPGSVAFTLATVNGNVGSFGTASSVGTFTVNAKGLITAASSTSIQIAESQVTNLVTDLASKMPISGGTFTGNITIGTHIIYAQNSNGVSGTNADVNSVPTSMTRLTNPGLVSIASITNTGAVTAQRAAFYNDTGNTITIVNNYGSVPGGSDEIITGAGENVTIADKGTLVFDYDSGSGGRWHLIGTPGKATASNTGPVSSADWTTFNNKEPAITAGTTAQYWRGDKSFQDLGTAVRAVALTGFSAAAGVVAATDTILQAFNKIVGNIALKFGSVTYTPSTPSRTLNSNFTPSSTNAVDVCYSVNISCSSTVIASCGGRIELRSDTNATPTTVRAAVQTSLSGVLATNNEIKEMCYKVPPGHNVRLVTVTVTGSPSFAISYQSEVETAFGP